MSAARLPAHIEVNGLVRAAQNAGGFGAVLAKGERDAGTLLVVCCHNGKRARAYERMPQADGSRQWVLAKADSLDEERLVAAYCDSRKRQDSDLWIIELDVAGAESLLGLPAN